MEEKVFRRVAVATELQRFVEARLHTDHADAERRAEYRKLQGHLAENLANPTYVAINPRTGVKLGEFFGATLADDAPFIRFLHDAWQNRDRKGERVFE